MSEADDEELRRAAIEALDTRLDAPVVALRSDDHDGAGPNRVRRLSFQSNGVTCTVEVRAADGEFVVDLKFADVDRVAELWGPRGPLATFEPRGAVWQTRTSSTGPVRGVFFEADGSRRAVLQTEWFALP